MLCNIINKPSDEQTTYRVLSKTMEKSDSDKGEIIIYQTSKKEVELRVLLKHEALWLSQAQIAKLFGTQRPAVTKHLGNVLETGELDKNSVCSILEHTASEARYIRPNFIIKNQDQTYKILSRTSRSESRDESHKQVSHGY